jgi:hypothetical protein
VLAKERGTYVANDIRMKKINIESSNNFWNGRMEISLKIGSVW